MLLLQQLFIAAVKVRLHFLLPMILPGKYFAQGSRIKTGMSHQLAYAIRKLTQDIAYQLRIQMTACQHTEEMLPDALGQGCRRAAPPAEHKS